MDFLWFSCQFCDFTHKNESTIFSLTCLCIVCKKFSALWTSEAMQWLKGGNRLVKQQFVKRHFLLLTFIQKEISQWKTWQSNHVLIKGTFLLSLILLLHWLLLTFKLSILYCSSTNTYSSQQSDCGNVNYILTGLGSTFSRYILQSASPARQSTKKFRPQAECWIQSLYNE